MSTAAGCLGRKIGTVRPRPRRRVSLGMWAALILGLGLVLASTLGAALVSPGRAIRSELTSAAADLRQSHARPDDAALRRLRRHFSRQSATVDARAWPQVAVTLHGLPRDTCREAAGAARRIEGLVVVELQRYRSADECGATNDMTWRFMP
ncbi:MAG TPA: hypothetical protein VJO12_02650 [Stellaceae bacterium]|nr:hypothetical protein [Stellaceae bacterium]